MNHDKIGETSVKIIVPNNKIKIIVPNNKIQYEKVNKSISNSLSKSKIIFIIENEIQKMVSNGFSKS